ncbi:nucleoside diphosphate kinase homolog 5-like [Denticeps clupeoides]|uniref:Nucleoside diphosphate kinase homolog 5 n=1 Tax=Denticeps clupeoides TaxID=299321 RepID=A0AAY4B6E9_9TELE|nr:nucleoside diphosphate kinase homolog 5-like [Denticeps clupeoides]
MSETPQIRVERTLALIKPDAVHRSDEIEDFIVRNGFIILEKRRLHLTPDQCADFYSDQCGQLFFPSLTAFMSSGPIVALVLARYEAIATWKALMGQTSSTKAKETHPDCLRAKYGTSDLRNAVHGSETSSAADREIRFMFPNMVAEPILSGDAAKDFLSTHVNPTLQRGLTELCKTKPADPVIWLANWLLTNNPNSPKILFRSVT